MFVIARCASGGAAPSISVSERRMSTILSMCSIVTGHASTHAAQVVQAHSSSGFVSTQCAGAVVSAFASPSSFGPSRSSWSRMSRTIFCGSSVLPVASAGQLSEQRPHSVQVYPSSSCFHEKSRTLAAPKVSLFSMSSISCSAPRGRDERKNTFGSVVTMCRCFVRGR